MVRTRASQNKKDTNDKKYNYKNNKLSDSKVKASQIKKKINDKKDNNKNNKLSDSKAKTSQRENNTNDNNTINTFGESCVLSYEVFPPDKNNIHERQFNVNSISGNKYTITINRLVNCTCPDCQNRQRRCKHIDFIMNEILHEKYPRIYYDNRALDDLFKYLPGNIPHKCE